MFSSLKSAVGCVLCTGVFFSCVFAVDVSQTLVQKSQDQFSSQDIFQGKLTIGDLYNQSLRLAKQNEVISTQFALDQIAQYYAHQSCTLSSKDIFYLLADSDVPFDTFTAQILGTKDTTATRTKAIQKAYAHMFKCKKIPSEKQGDSESIKNIQREIYYLYYQFLSSSYLGNSMVQDNYGEDLFRNGDPDDSPFDILVDIQSIGKLFFTTFQSPPTPLFYRLPKISDADQQGLSMLSELSAAIPPKDSSSFTTPASSRTFSGMQRVTFTGTQPSLVTPKTNTLVSPSFVVSARSSSASSLPSSVSSDVDIQHFVSTTDVEPPSADFNFVLGNQCVSGSVPQPSLAEQQQATISPEAYLSGMAYFFDHVSVQDLENAHLLSGFAQRYAQSPSTLGGVTTASTSSSTSPSSSTLSGNSYDGQAFAGAPASSPVAACQSLPLDKQFACQLSGTKSCINKCSALPLDEKVLCVNDCSCFMVSGPLGGTWKVMENMFSIKFCTAPVEFSYMQRGKTVFSLEGIFKEVYAILNGLKRSGETTQKKKTSEFLSLDISPNLSDLLDFTIRIVIKPLFAQASTLQATSRVSDNQKLVHALLGLSAADTYNDYVVLANPAQDAAALEANSTDTDIQKITTLSTALGVSSKDTEAFYNQQKDSFLSEDILQFLQVHQQFWQTTFNAFVSMMQDASTLEDKINQSQ